MIDHTNKPLLDSTKRGEEDPQVGRVIQSLKEQRELVDKVDEDLRHSPYTSPPELEEVRMYS